MKINFGLAKRNVMIYVSWRVFLMYNLDVRAVGDDFMCCYHK